MTKKTKDERVEIRSTIAFESEIPSGRWTISMENLPRDVDNFPVAAVLTAYRGLETFCQNAFPDAKGLPLSEFIELLEDHVGVERMETPYLC